MTLARDITADEIIVNINRELTKAKELLVIYKVLTVELEKYDRKKLTSRIEKDVLESLGKNRFNDDKYHVNYTKDNSERSLRVRGRGSSPTIDERITLERLSLKTQPLFEFEKWYGASPANRIQEQVLRLQGYLAMPEIIDVTVNDINTARKILAGLQATFKDQTDLTSYLLPDEAHDMIREIRFMV